MKTAQISKLFTTLLFALFFVTLAQGQNDTDCDKSTKNCLKTEENAKAEKSISESNTDSNTDSNETKVAKLEKKAFGYYRLKTQTDGLSPSRFQLLADDKKSSLTLAVSTAGVSAENPQQQQQPEDTQKLAKQLANPISSLISLPFQNNFDFGMGPNRDGFRYTLNIQPVIPFSLNKDWNLISRTILPIIGQNKVVGTSSQFGLGDVLQSLFFSPKKIDPFIWGVGPAVLIPTGTNQYLGTQKLAIGPTFVILKQMGPWTVGALANHLWSVAGKDSRANVNSTFIQPFLGYTTKSAWTFTINTETSYDWRADKFSVPIHVVVQKLVRFGKQPVSVGGSLRCWAATFEGGPRNCGFRIIITPLFPKK
jgi:hypothetical protein